MLIKVDLDLQQFSFPTKGTARWSSHWINGSDVAKVTMGGKPISYENVEEIEEGESGILILDWFNNRMLQVSQ